jgi:hypothetical protein
MNKPNKPVAQRSASNKRPSAGSPSDPVFLPPLRPHRRLTLALGILLAAWLVALLVAYFKTVYPLRHEQPRTTRAIVETK